MSQALQSIDKCCDQSSFGGLVKLSYIPHEWVNEWPYGFHLGDQSSIDLPIILEPGKDWLTLCYFHRSLGFDVRERATKQGSVYTRTIQGEFPVRIKKVSDTGRLVERMSRHRFIIRLTDHYKEDIIFGSPDDPLNFKANRKKDKTLSGGDKYSFSFQGDTTYRPFKITV